MSARSSIDPIWWLWVPLLFMAVQIVMEYCLPDPVLSAALSEWGPHETLQFAVITLAFLVAIDSVLRVEWRTQKLLGCWLALASVCCLYVSGEELSWGQHVFEWHTSEFWSGVNDQGETNLHNTSSWFDQKPRLLLLIGIVVGGLIVPFLNRFRPGYVPDRFRALYPASALWVIALLVVAPQLVEKLGETMGYATFARVSEVQELYMFYFVLLYLWDLRARELPK